jgi:hypothetical protein
MTDMVVLKGIGDRPPIRDALRIAPIWDAAKRKVATLLALWWNSVSFYRTLELGCVGHIGIFGPQVGTGILAVADWWLTIAFAEAGDFTAAAAPATTTVRAKMRTTSFMDDYLNGVKFVTGGLCLPLPKILP